MRRVLALAAALSISTNAVHAAGRAGLEQRVERLEAESAIRSLLVRYGATLDARDYAAYAELFSDGGVWIGSYGTFTGREAIHRMLVENMGVPEVGRRNTANFHMMTNPLITVTGNRAHADSRFLFWVKDQDGRPSPLMAGRYEDEFVRERGEWKIARRKAWGVIPWSDPEDPAYRAGAAGTAAPVALPVPAGTGEIDDRLRRVEDLLAIQRLQIEYSGRLDARDIDGYVALFAPEATWQVGTLIKHGPDEIRRLLLDLYGPTPNGFVNMSEVSIVADPRIELHGDHATGTVRHVLLQRGAHGEPVPVLTGQYTDEYVREDGAWKILHRVDRPVMPTADEWRKQMATKIKRSSD